MVYLRILGIFGVLFFFPGLRIEARADQNRVLQGCEKKAVKRAKEEFYKILRNADDDSVAVPSSLDRIQELEVKTWLKKVNGRTFVSLGYAKMIGDFSVQFRLLPAGSRPRCLVTKVDEVQEGDESDLFNYTDEFMFPNYESGGFDD